MLIERVTTKEVVRCIEPTFGTRSEGHKFHQPFSCKKVTHVASTSHMRVIKTHQSSTDSSWIWLATMNGGRRCTQIDDQSCLIIFFFAIRRLTRFSLRGRRQSAQVTQVTHNAGERPSLASHHNPNYQSLSYKLHVEQAVRPISDDILIISNIIAKHLLY
jgi:hypothetical protein